MNDKISIIIPVYNLEKYIARTIDSVCQQTYSNLEIVVVDDGSKDESWDIICKYAENDSRIIPIHQENGGVTSARLNGVKHATGEWIGFVDGDDTIDKCMYERLISNALKYNAQISHCGYKMFFKDGRIKYFYNTNRLVEQDNVTGLKDLLQGSFVEPGLWNKLFHNTLFHDLLQDNTIDYSIKNNEDLLMNFFLFKNSNKSIYEDFCPYNYIVRDNSASRVLNEHSVFDPIRVKKIIFDNACDDIKTECKKAYIQTCINVYCGLTINDYMNYSDQVYKLIKQESEYINSLNKNMRILGKIILFNRIFFSFAYRVYSKCFQRKKYE